jgi:hypothetical protein
MIYGLGEKIQVVWEKGAQDNKRTQDRGRERERQTAEEVKEWRRLRSYRASESVLFIKYSVLYSWIQKVWSGRNIAYMAYERSEVQGKSLVRKPVEKSLWRPRHR